MARWSPATKHPVLTLNRRCDAFFPLESTPDPFCDLPAIAQAPEGPSSREQPRHPRHRLIGETLNWLGEFRRTREPRVRYQAPG